MFSKADQVGSYGRKGKKEKGFKRDKADKWFSLFIRLRDVVTVRGDGVAIAPCITCGKYGDIRYMDCGHFVTRNHPLTRFNEQNAHAQCKGCNEFKKGDQAKHLLAIDKKYGHGTAEKLIQLGSIRGQKKYTTEAINVIAEEYRIKTNKIYNEFKKLGLRKWW